MKIADIFSLRNRDAALDSTQKNRCRWSTDGEELKNSYIFFRRAQQRSSSFACHQGQAGSVASGGCFLTSGSKSKNSQRLRLELGAVDYLLKPFDLERVKKSVERLKEKSEELNVRQSGADIHKLMVNSGTSYQVLDVSEIVYIETDKRACRIHTKERDYIQNESMNFYENRLRGDRFFRIHKSYLINLDYVLEMVPGFNNGYSLKMKYFEKERLPIGRTQVREFRNLFFM